MSQEVIHHKSLALHFKPRNWFQKWLSLSFDFYASNRGLDYSLICWFFDGSLYTFFNVLSGWFFSQFLGSLENYIFLRLWLWLDWVRNRRYTITGHSRGFSIVEFISGIWTTRFYSWRRWLLCSLFHFVYFTVHEGRKKSFCNFLFFLSRLRIRLRIVKPFFASIFSRKGWVIPSSYPWIRCSSTHESVGAALIILQGFNTRFCNCFRSLPIASIVEELS